MIFWCIDCLFFLELHRLTSLDRLSDSLSEKYGSLVASLDEKLSKIMRLKKSTWLNLEDLVQRSKDMSIEVEKSVSQQVIPQSTSHHISCRFFHQISTKILWLFKAAVG